MIRPRQHSQLEAMGVAGPKTKKPSAMAGLRDLVMCCCGLFSITARKIDMMGLIYDQTAIMVKRHL